MTTITLDILDDKAMDLLKDLEAMHVIRLHDTEITTEPKSVKKYKGLMTKQSIEEIDKQLNDLRNEWD